MPAAFATFTLIGRDMTTLQILILVACGAGALSDLRTKRIPNALTASSALLFLGVHFQSGASSFFLALAVVTVAVVLGFFLQSFRFIGGGDVKLIAAVAGGFSYPDCFAFILYTMLAGGILAAATALVRGSLRASFFNASMLAYPALFYRTAGYSMPSAGIKIPYGIAIFAGAATLILAQTVLPFLRLPM
ncbi:MAG: prepilin peptidase [Candidatus Baltobacteraceae bacterium]